MSNKLIGTGPNQVPTNADLGSMAYQDSNYVSIGGGVATLSSLTVTDYSKFEVAATNKPTIPTTLNMDFAKTQSLDNRVEFSRASIATRVNAKGYIETVTNDVPRFDYDPVTLACKGLLIEESRTNGLTYSEQFDNAAWTKGQATITANAIASPDGTTDADFLVESTATTVDHYTFQAFSFVSGTSYTFSVYAKSTNRNLMLLLSSAAFTSGQQYVFDLTAGTASLSSGTATGGIQSVGNGWYRCWITAQATATVATNVVIYTASGTTRAYTGDGTSGVYVWGAQLEVGTYPTSYIPTTTAAVTRQADVAKITGTNFSSFYNQTEGTFYVEATAPVFNSAVNSLYNPDILSVSDNTVNNRIAVYRSVTPLNAVGLYNVYSGTNDVEQTNGAGGWANSAFIKAAASYKANDYVLCQNQVTYADSAATVPTVSQMNIGSSFSTAQGFFNGCIGKIAYYPKRVTNTELAALTRV